MEIPTCKTSLGELKNWHLRKSRSIHFLDNVTRFLLNLLNHPLCTTHKGILNLRRQMQHEQGLQIDLPFTRENQFKIVCPSVRLTLFCSTCRSQFLRLYIIDRYRIRSKDGHYWKLLRWHHFSDYFPLKAVFWKVIKNHFNGKLTVGPSMVNRSAL